MGCQKKIAEKIRAKEGDYLLQVKENHPKLREAIRTAFFDSLDTKFKQLFSDPAEILSPPKHGRRETRKCWVSKTVDFCRHHTAGSAFPELL